MAGLPHSGLTPTNSRRGQCTRGPKRNPKDEEISYRICTISVFVALLKFAKFLKFKWDHLHKNRNSTQEEASGDQPDDAEA